MKILYESHTPPPRLVIFGVIPADDEITRNHLAVTQAGADHRINAGVRIDDYFQECRSRKLNELLDRVRDIVLVIKAFGVLKTVRLRGFHEILPMQ